MDLMQKWASKVRCIHGSGGLGVLTQPGLETGWYPFYYPLMIKYPSLDYDAMGDYWSEVRHGGYELPKSSNWLTFLGVSNIERLGGEDAVRSQITPEISLVRYEGGYLIRAGERPVVDTNGVGGVPQAYKDIARIIRPILFQKYEYGIIEVPPEKDSLDETLKWIHRFES